MTEPITTIFYCLKVLYGKADIGLAKISYTAERQNLLDYSHPIGEDTAYWISR